MDNLLNEANYFLDAEHQVQKNAQQEQMNLLVENISDADKKKVGALLKDVQKDLENFKRKYITHGRIYDVNYMLDIIKDFDEVVTGSVEFTNYKKDYLDDFLSTIESLLATSLNDKFKNELKNIGNKVKKIK